MGLFTRWTNAVENMPDEAKTVFARVAEGFGPLLDKIKDFATKLKEKYEEILKESQDKDSTQPTNADTKDDKDTRTQNGRESVDSNRDKCLSAIDSYEKNMIMYCTERDEYNAKMAAIETYMSRLSPDSPLYDTMMEAQQALKDKYLKKDDGTYYDSMEDKYDVSSTAADMSVDDVMRQTDEARKYVMLDTFDYDAVKAQFAIIEDHNNKVSDNLHHMDDINKTVDMTVAADKIIQEKQAESVVDTYETHLRMYFDEKSDYAKELEKVNSSELSEEQKNEFIQELKDKYLKKDDGTYYDSLEEKYGVDPESDIAKATDISEVKELDDLRAQIKSPDFDPNSESFQKIKETNDIVDNNIFVHSANKERMEDLYEHASIETHLSKDHMLWVNPVFEHPGVYIEPVLDNPLIKLPDTFEPVSSPSDDVWDRFTDAIKSGEPIEFTPESIAPKYLLTGEPVQFDQGLIYNVPKQGMEPEVPLGALRPDQLPELNENNIDSIIMQINKGSMNISEIIGDDKTRSLMDEIKRDAIGHSVEGQKHVYTIEEISSNLAHGKTDDDIYITDSSASKQTQFQM